MVLMEGLSAGLISWMVEKSEQLSRGREYLYLEDCGALLQKTVKWGF